MSENPAHAELVQLIELDHASSFQLEAAARRDEGYTPSVAGATFAERTLTKFTFDRVDLTNVAFERCALTECTFLGCIFDGTLFDACMFMDCVFRSCGGEDTAFETCTMTHTIFEQVEMSASEWTDTQGVRCRLRSLTLRDPLWERITLRESEMVNVSMQGGHAHYVTLRDPRGAPELAIEQTELKHCYVIGAAPSIPDGFERRSGRRRVL